jgi:hypothetical protein
MKRCFALAALLTAVVLLSVAPAFAHEGREVGDYVLEFGWRTEPAYAGILNGPEVYISLHDAGAGEAFPADIVVALQAEVIFGGEALVIPLQESWLGQYTGTLVPTLPGDYRFRIFGTIGETEVDVTFDSADGEFSTVEPSTDVMFPSAGMADTAALLARIEALEARLAALENAQP